MSRKRTYIAFGVLFLALVFIFFLLWKKDKYDWWHSYLEKSKEPYGTHVVLNLLKDAFSDYDFIVLEDSLSKSLPTETDGVSNYIFIGEGQLIDTLSIITLFEFVENGNNAFISSKTILRELSEEFFSEETDFYNSNEYLDYLPLYDTIAMLNFHQTSFKDTAGFFYKVYFKNRTKGYSWNYIPDKYLEGYDFDFGFKPLGYIEDSLLNFIKLDYGDGSFYLHTTPVVFTNIELLDKKGLEYVSNVFSFLPQGTIYWDKISRVSEMLAKRRNFGRQRRNRLFNKEGPLVYILSQPPLAWAWYIGLGLVVFYLLFRAKRKQRIIPVLEKNTNTSLEFVETIGKLSFQQSGHSKLAKQKIKLFKTYIWQHYHLPTGVMDDNFAKQLKQKSDLPEALINKILTLTRNIESSNFISENTLIEFHGLLDRFYKEGRL